LCLMPAHLEWPDKLEAASEHAFDEV